MKIWELKSSFDGYQSFQLLSLEEGNQSDFPHFWGEVGTPMVSEKAKQFLESMLGNNVEFLPLIHNVTGEVYYIINVLNAIDAIDYEKAILKKLRSGLVIDFKKYAFLPNMVKNQTIFKVYLNEILHIPSVFVSDEFRNAVLKSDLKGFEFVEVWDSEANM
ncbi:imm11 family protein [Bacillus toyonensis]|uniref:Immunity MXAN-0049 protein domain-containing protein n=1 Tax=Bacillus toyonensis TaxID=155322 RepID=A0AB36SCZ6_9BACI|nr:DUF1629 domain-containing protein [Bacillus toyonensis]MCG3797071.1 hypothetical protein [Bacillus toyonensis]PEE79234.1 hypothetical protein COO15_29775 [Bacillus toyonensis]PEJ83599.1 hypothetical protein CN891_26770 [Bacillus toyonensis]PEK09310.1 hypothetical protein CN683_28925 [Bacillus toyonensis]PEL33325.1 hypothetical protein CN623_17280 [Bacillus toyonensis]